MNIKYLVLTRACVIKKTQCQIISVVLVWDIKPSPWNSGISHTISILSLIFWLAGNPKLLIRLIGQALYLLGIILLHCTSRYFSMLLSLSHGVNFLGIEHY